MASSVTVNKPPDYSQAGKSERTADKDKKGPVIVRIVTETDGKKPILDKNIPILIYHNLEKGGRLRAEQKHRMRS